MTSVDLTQKVLFKEIKEGEATHILREEHKLIFRLLDALDQTVVYLQENKNARIPYKFFDGVIDFLTVFVEGCHENKETEALFPLLVRGGVPVQGGPIGQTLGEHMHGAEIIVEMERGLKYLRMGDKSGRLLLLSNAMRYSEFLREHIKKEDTFLLLVADSLFTDEAQKDITEHFHRIEANYPGSAKMSDLRELVAKLTSIAAGL